MINTRDAFRDFDNLSVLIIGDVMVDSYLWGKVDRISPEAPVPVVSVEGKEHRLGGAANVALNIKSLGANPILCSVVGTDDMGIVLAQLLAQLGMSGEGIVPVDDRKTTSKMRIISGAQHCLRIDDEITYPINSLQEKLLFERIESLVKTHDVHAIVFEDYDKGVITQNLINLVTELVRGLNITVTVDPKKRNFMCYHDVTLFKPNFKELCEGVNVEVKKNDFETIRRVVNAFQEEKCIKHMMVTLSELGMVMTDGVSFCHVPTHAREVADVSGAGDTVISVATLCLAAGLDAMTAAKISNIAAGIVCEFKGVVPINKEKLLHEVQEQNL